MASYFLGDIHGCHQPLQQLLHKMGFSASRDVLYVLGDMVNRGPDNVGVLRSLIHMGSSARCILGNHDLLLLSVAAGVRALRAGDTLQDVLGAPDRRELLRWLRMQPLVRRTQGFYLLHAGVLPQWSEDDVWRIGQELSNILRQQPMRAVLNSWRGPSEGTWDDALTKLERQRMAVHALTRLRYCDAQGRMNLKYDGPPGSQPSELYPWHSVPHRKTAGAPIACGHWSAQGLVQRDDLIALDTGCVWGGPLTAYRVAQREDPQRPEHTPAVEATIFQV